jgi:hypothetical protein
MKIGPLALSASLLVNVALVGLILAARPSDTPALVSTPSGAAPANASGPPEKSETNTWAALATGDLAAQRDRLLAEGFPPATIRAILAAQIREGFAARRKALDTAAADAPFWKPARPDPVVQAQLRALGREEQKAIEALLGPDPDNNAIAELRRQIPGASDEKLAQLREIQTRYAEQTSKIYGDRPGTLLPDERQKINALQKAMHDEFAAVLSPEELEAYDLRASPTANQLRYNLTAFDATEDEYRAIFKVQRAYDEQLRDLAPTLGSGPLTPEQSRARQTIQEQLNADLKAALGDQRYADYQRAMDYNYRQTTQLVARLNLPPQTANELYAVQKEMEQRRMNFAASANGTALTREQAMEQMTALQQEATARVTSALGGNAAALEAYKQYGGSWLANLVPRPPRPLGPATGPARGGGGGGG